MRILHSLALTFDVDVKIENMNTTVTCCWPLFSDILTETWECTTDKVVNKIILSHLDYTCPIKQYQRVQSHICSMITPIIPILITSKWFGWRACVQVVIHTHQPRRSTLIAQERLQLLSIQSDLALCSLSLSHFDKSSINLITKHNETRPHWEKPWNDKSKVV
jgi:hypothetical protein